MTGATSRDQIAHQACDALDALTPELLADRPALVGFDGFVDAIIHVVDHRRSMRHDDYERIRTIPEFAARAGAAAGRSANIELVVQEERYGGNGPLLAGALGRLGAPVTFIGAVGTEADPTSLHPLYEPFAERCARTLPVSPPGHTDALEFDDGKLMLGKPQNVQAVNWQHLETMVGRDQIEQSLADASLIGTVNWTLCGGLESIWRELLDIIPRLPDRPGGRRLFVDLADPAKRTDDDLANAIELLRKLNDAAPLTLGLNLAEAERVARVIGLGAFAPDADDTFGHAMRDSAAALREALNIDTVAVHPRHGAAAARAGGDAAWFDGPFTRTPRLSTGAGDHFNAGFAFAQIHSLPLDQCLAVGCAVSGAYVRDAVSPDRSRLCRFLRGLPNPEHPLR